MPKGAIPIEILYNAVRFPASSCLRTASCRRLGSSRAIFCRCHINTGITVRGNCILHIYSGSRYAFLIAGRVEPRCPRRAGAPGPVQRRRLYHAVRWAWTVSRLRAVVRPDGRRQPEADPRSDPARPEPARPRQTRPDPIPSLRRTWQTSSAHPPDWQPPALHVARRPIAGLPGCFPVNHPVLPCSRRGKEWRRYLN
jgi:hypothetical protein